MLGEDMQPIHPLQTRIDTRPPVPQTRQQCLCLCKHETHWKSNFFSCIYARPAAGTCVIHGLEGQSLLLGQGTQHKRRHLDPSPNTTSKSGPSWQCWGVQEAQNIKLTSAFAVCHHQKTSGKLFMLATLQSAQATNNVALIRMGV